MKKSGSNTQIQAINKQSSSKQTKTPQTYKQTTTLTTTTIAKHTNKNKTLLIHKLEQNTASDRDHTVKAAELSSNNWELGFGEKFWSLLQPAIV
jgi:hypothetical protein